MGILPPLQTTEDQKYIFKKGILRDVSVGKVLAMQAGTSEFGSPDYV